MSTMARSRVVVISVSLFVRSLVNQPDISESHWGAMLLQNDVREQLLGVGGVLVPP